MNSDPQGRRRWKDARIRPKNKQQEMMMKELAKALIKAQTSMGKLVKDSKNPHFKSSYASLHAVIEVAKLELFKAGIAVFEASSSVDGKPVQQLSLVHCESGESWDSEFPLLCKDPTNPQQLMSCQTYARRALWTATAGGLAPQDDDGNTASTPPKTPPPKGEHGLPQQIGSRPASTLAQQKKLGIMFKALGRENQLQHDLTAFAGRKVTTFKELARGEAEELIKRMMAKAGEDK